MATVRTLFLFALAALCGGCTRPDRPLPPASDATAPAAANPAPTPMPTPTTVPEVATAPNKTEVATLAGGCFWCIEAVLERIDGVLDVESGYTGGTVDNPTYKQVCNEDTGHAEAVQVTYDPAKLTYAQLLDYFFQLHDPTTMNRQGNDVGTQYRSAIFYHSEDQKQQALTAIAHAQEKHRDLIVTEVVPAAKFWSAEGYHQDYFQNNPTNSYCRIMIPPKLKKLGLDK